LANAHLEAAKEAEFEAMTVWQGLNDAANKRRDILATAQHNLNSADRALSTRKELAGKATHIEALRVSLEVAAEKEGKQFNEYRRLVELRELAAQEHHAAVSTATELSTAIDSL
jgi:hypothetical protein